MKWWYWIIVAIVIAVGLFAYVQFGHAQAVQMPVPTALPTAFNKAAQPFPVPSSTPTPMKMVPPPGMSH